MTPFTSAIGPPGELLFSSFSSGPHDGLPQFENYKNDDPGHNNPAQGRRVKRSFLENGLQRLQDHRSTGHGKQKWIAEQSLPEE
ncbi:MAG: hypothetical protein IPQ16_12275 [Geobacteraceae bacterium]|nr:hypothetical protein [Geobacteraceae bacterium]